MNTTVFSNQTERTSDGSTFISRFDEPTLGEIIANETKLRLPASSDKGKLLKAFRDSESAAHGVAADFNTMLNRLDHESNINLTPVAIPAEISTLEHREAQETFQQRHQELVENLEMLFIDELERASRANSVGRIEWFGPEKFGTPQGCRFNFYEKERSRTLTKIKTRTFNNVHDLVDVKKHKLPANGVKKPKQCQEVIDAMPRWMQKHAFIVTGTLINRERQQVVEHLDDNEVLRAAKATGRAIGRGARAVGRGIDNVNEKAKAVFEKMNEITILDDPALIIGDFVLYGWLE